MGPGLGHGVGVGVGVCSGGSCAGGLEPFDEEGEGEAVLGIGRRLKFTASVRRETEQKVF